jgi:acyl dehydratase
VNTTADALLTAGTVAVGQTREVVVTENLTRTQIVQYAGASGDFNPLHTDEPYAVQVAGYDTVLAHGLLTMGMAGTAVTDWVGAGRLVRYGVRFKSPVFPGDALTTRLAVTEVQAGADSVLVTLSVDTVNGKGEAVVTGHAEARLPR